MKEILDSNDAMGKPSNDTQDSRFKENMFPTLAERVKALFVDILIILAIFTATSLFIDVFGDIPNFLRGFILVFMLYLYDPVFTSLTGSTLGHKLMKLKVRRYSNPERKISILRAAIRFFIKWALGWLSFLTVTSNRHKRGIHDMISGSIVLKEE